MREFRFLPTDDPRRVRALDPDGHDTGCIVEIDNAQLPTTFRLILPDGTRLFAGYGALNVQQKLHEVVTLGIRDDLIEPDEDDGDDDTNEDEDDDAVE